MPVNKNALVRFLVIHESLKNGNKITIDDLTARVSEYMNEKVSSRTLRQDFAILKNHFNVVVEYKNSHYFYQNKDQSFLGLSDDNISNDILLNYSLRVALKNEINAPYLLHDNNDLYKNTDYGKQIKLVKNHLEDILKALHHQYFISMEYASPENIKPKKYKKDLLPIALKFYHQTWYLFAKFDTSENNVLTFALHRITSLKVKKDLKIEDEELQQANMEMLMKIRDRLKYVIGISMDKDYAPNLEPETVVLEFTSYQAKFIRSNPWHWTQKEILTTEASAQFSFQLIINWELISLILSLYNKVKVISPTRLKDEVLKRLKAAQDMYQ